MAHHKIEIPERLNLQFEFTPTLRKRILFLIGVGVILTILGIIFIAFGGPEHGSGGNEHGHATSPLGIRLWGNLLLNGFYFLSLSLILIFFIAVQTVSNASWYILLKRIFESFSSSLPIWGGLLLIIFLIASHTLYHWTHHEVVQNDPVLLSKESYLNVPFFLIRAILIFALWTFFGIQFRKLSLQDDLHSDVNNFNRQMRLSGIFIVVFALTYSVASWDWIMSINPHWFSTMFAVYTFASGFVASLALVTMIAIYLYQNNYLPYLNLSHFHDLGKFVFAFSIFWCYIWYGQFMLIWYANIPEETQWFVPMFKHYEGIFFFNLIINFLFPFLGLMTNESKRNLLYLLVVCKIVFIGHWVDFYLMVFPNLAGEMGHIGLLEFGLFCLFTGIFLYIGFHQLTKRNLVPQYHPYTKESILHYYEI